MMSEAKPYSLVQGLLIEALSFAGFAVTDGPEDSEESSRVYVQLEGGSETVDRLLKIVSDALAAGRIGERYSERMFMSSEPRWTYEIIPFETAGTRDWCLETLVSMSLDDADELSRLVRRAEF